MTSEPLAALSPVDWYGNYDTGRVGCYFELDQPGWLLVMTFASYAGAVQMISVGIHYAEGLDPIDDVVQPLVDTAFPTAAAEHPFRYRWMRDVGQQFEQVARRSLRETPGLLDFLATQSWYETKTPTKGYGLSFYAEVARDFVAAGGSFEALSELRSVGYDTAHGWIKKARSLGVLSSPGRGRRGHSDLTQLGREVLDGKR